MRVSADPPVGRRVVNAKGLVVAPGFVDLHQHGQDLDSGRAKAFDGVTTELEMAISVPASRALQASVTLVEALGGGRDAEKLPALP
jgi:N-acyl-D-aspartate/D-glutamate deacylase